jgi:hypothetical protein
MFKERNCQYLFWELDPASAVNNLNKQPELPMRIIQKVKTISTHVLTLPGTFSFHPPYSTDLEPSDFHLFTRVKQFWFLAGMSMCSDEVKKMVEDWFNGLAEDFYYAGNQELIAQYNKCLNLHGD